MRFDDISMKTDYEYCRFPEVDELVMVSARCDLQRERWEIESFHRNRCK